jgi:hypothetical protein
MWRGVRHITTTYISQGFFLITSSYLAFPTSLVWVIATWRGGGEFFVCLFVSLLLIFFLGWFGTGEEAGGAHAIARLW